MTLEDLQKRILELEKMNDALLMTVLYGKTQAQMIAQHATMMQLAPFTVFEAS